MADMILKENINFVAFPSSFKRGNPIPLDVSSIWYNYDEMASYASSNVTAYVGQILGLIDIEKSSAKAYIILNKNGDLKELGTAPLVDNATIEITNDALSLKDFGKRYYKYIPEQKDDLGEVVQNARYEIQEVNEEFPWKSGLEPRVTFENNTFILGWYEPNPTTIDGINNQITILQTSVSNLEKSIENVYTKTEVDTMLASANHLTRKIMDNLEAVEKYVAENDDADQYIFMVPSGLKYDDNKYSEYIVIDGKIEKVGAWEVDLDDYAKKTDVESAILPLVKVEDLNKKLEDYATNESLGNKVEVKEGYDLVSVTEIEKLITVKENAEPNFISSVDTNELLVTEGKLSIVSIPQSKVENLETILASKIEAKDGYGLISNEDLNKLQNIKPHIIESVSNEFTISEEKELKINFIESSKVIGLDELIGSVSSLNNVINGTYNEDGSVNTLGLTATVANLVTEINNIKSDYVSIIDFNTVVGSLEEMKNNEVNILNEIENIKSTLQWEDMKE